MGSPCTYIMLVVALVSLAHVTSKTIGTAEQAAAVDDVMNDMEDMDMLQEEVEKSKLLQEEKDAHYTGTRHTHGNAHNTHKHHHDHDHDAPEQSTSPQADAEVLGSLKDHLSDLLHKLQDYKAFKENVLEEREDEAEDVPVPEEDIAEDAPVPEEQIFEDAPVPEEDIAEDVQVPGEDIAEDVPVSEEQIFEDSPVPEEQIVEDAPVPEEQIVEDAPVPEEEIAEDAPVPEEDIFEDAPVPEEEIVEDAPGPEEEIVEDAPVPEEEIVEDSAVPEEEIAEDASAPQKSKYVKKLYAHLEDLKDKLHKYFQLKRKDEVVLEDPKDAKKAIVGHLADIRGKVQKLLDARNDATEEEKVAITESLEKVRAHLEDVKEKVHELVELKQKDEVAVEDPKDAKEILAGHLADVREKVHKLLDARNDATEEEKDTINKGLEKVYAKLEKLKDHLHKEVELKQKDEVAVETPKDAKKILAGHLADVREKVQKLVDAQKGATEEEKDTIHKGLEKVYAKLEKLKYDLHKEVELKQKDDVAVEGPPLPRPPKDAKKAIVGHLEHLRDGVQKLFDARNDATEEEKDAINGRLRKVYDHLEDVKDKLHELVELKEKDEVAVETPKDAKKILAGHLTDLKDHLQKALDARKDATEEEKEAINASLRNVYDHLIDLKDKLH